MTKQEERRGFGMKKRRALILVVLVAFHVGAAPMASMAQSPARKYESWRNEDRLWCPERAVNLNDTIPTFERRSAKLTPHGKCAIRNLVLGIKQSHAYDIKIAIVGHADVCMSAEADLALSRERALVVEAWLLAAGVDPAVIQQVRWVGHGVPLLSKPSACDQSLNDRVETDLLSLSIPRQREK
ncbi:hypothetical protein EBB59_06115 [Lysobacter pythonis]|uniref:OmpA-like domain-containing protein n=1 Tax=Solilutibacter pythonis TaxID=2483112 RepID=A0A3M2HZ38_9GAMM|nr:OmpA family protein [Lysobacter pythonis]RMH93113.1 hypothetical protein EBB59_06115 [Lysobacter pythonis]